MAFREVLCACGSSFVPRCEACGDALDEGHLLACNECLELFVVGSDRRVRPVTFIEFELLSPGEVDRYLSSAGADVTQLRGTAVFKRYMRLVEQLHAACVSWCRSNPRAALILNEPTAYFPADLKEMIPLLAQGDADTLDFLLAIDKATNHMATLSQFQVVVSRVKRPLTRGGSA
ncbi:MAG TPA: hypothetical protein VFQ61_06370 [Polyangiaceae bacterium]|nr:hypothetical protein [Polyangiaceae bacterium]